MRKITAFLTALLFTAEVFAQTCTVGYLCNMTDTWDDAGETWDVIKSVVTDTGSDADSKFIDMSASSGGIFQVLKGGQWIKPYFADVTDNTKTVNWDLTGISASTLRTITMPDANVNLSLIGLPVEGTAVLSTGEVAGTSVLTEKGDGTSEWRGVLDEDDFASDSATQLASQQSIKTYVDDATSSMEISFFLNDTASDIGGIYYDMTTNNLGGAESPLTTSGLVASTPDQDLVNFATDIISGLGILEIPAGTFEAHFHAARTVGNSQSNIYAEIYKRAAGGAETLIVTTELSSAITAKRGVSLHAHMATDTALLATDRIVLKLLVNIGSGSGATIVIYQEGTTVSRLVFPTTTEILNQIFVRQDSPELADDVFRIQDDGDLTRQIDFQASGITTGNTRTITMPDYDIDLGAQESFIIAISDETTDLTTGTAKVTFRMPYAFTLTAVRSSVTLAPTDAVFTVDINETGSTILGTKLTIDATEKTSTTADIPPVISDTTLADDAEMTIDIDTIGSTIAGTGAKVTMIGYQP